MSSKVLATSTFLLMTAAVVGFAAPAAAHAHITIDDVEFTLGWVNEPPLVDAPNSLDVRIKRILEPEHGEGEHHEGGSGHAHAAKTEPVTGAEKTLNASLTIGGKTKIIPLRAKWGTPGSYVGEVVPTVAGIYTLRVYGQAGNVTIDRTVEIQEVKPQSGVQFPETTTSEYEASQAVAAASKRAQDLEAKVTALEAKVAELQSSAPDKAAPTAGFAVALLGVLAVGLILRRRS